MAHPLRALLEDLPDADSDAASAVRDRAGQVLRPTGAFARLDEVAVHLAGWQATATPAVECPAVLVFAADHGIAAAGVSAYPSEVTGAMLAAVEQKVATINVLAKCVGATVSVFDVGVGRPTADFRHEPALTPERVEEAVATGIAAVDAAVDDGADLIVLGELGIGNTTAAAAIATVLLDGGPSGWVGRGTGVDDVGIKRKRDAVAAATERVGTLDDPLDALTEVGGAELLAMAAACVQARHRRTVVVLDGFLAAAAVLPLSLAHPRALAHCVAGHRSAEPGHRRLLDRFGLSPLLELDLRLGEGSGALAAVPLISMACRAVVDVPTFGEWFDT